MLVCMWGAVCQQYLVELRKLVDAQSSDVVDRHALLLSANKAEGDHHVLSVGCAKPVFYELAFPILHTSC